MISVDNKKLEELKKKECEVKAQSLLLDSDWSDLPSNRELLQNSEEWVQYRLALKVLRVHPVVNPVWPHVPSVLWKNLGGSVESN